MARRSPIKVGLALVLLCVVSHAKADDCRTGCRKAPQHYKYHDGTTYKYNFDSKIEVSLSSAEGQKSVTEVKATVLLTQQPQCNQILRLQNVQVIGNDGKKHNRIPDVDKPIRLNFNDGVLEDSICTVPGDSQNSLNLKRAIASLFQANLEKNHEIDVFGSCPTDISHHKEGNVLVIQKSKNLNRCAFRESIKQDFLATAFNLNSEVKSSPLLNGDYTAKIRIKNGILEHATINEHYLYVPFSVGNNGAKASVETTLKYVGTTKDNAQFKGNQPRSILFEDPHPVNSPTTNVNSILAAVKQVAKTIDITVGEHTAKEFTNLVRILRVSKKDDLLAVYNQVRAGVGFNDKIAAKKIFLDALLRAGNGDNIEVAIDLIKSRELNTIEQNLVYLGFSLVRHPTEGSLNSAATLLNQPNLPRTAYLGIGTLAGRYCRQHSCKNVDAVNKLTQKLVQKLGNGKASNRQEENEIIYVLKALGNIHHLSDGILAKIISIAQDKKAPNRLRVTALETYLADPCKDKLRDSALNILKDIQQDSEIRIKAYLAVAQCPNAKVGNAVKALLENEPSYQVGGFIVSHIRNLRSSANPDKELGKQHLGFINVPKRFPVDLRKYSANGEFSYTIDTLGVANSIESNVIYSQNSFLPRSTSLNLTAEVFGHTFNLLEIETRQENLDRLIEHYLGPRGLLRTNSLQELWDNKGKYGQKLVHELKERIGKSLRERRDVTKAEIDHIAKQVQIKTNELNNDLDLDLSIKGFGSEVLFLNVNDDVKQWTPEAIIDKIVSGLNTGLDKIKHFEETLRTNLLFLDAEFAYPTASGFPLRLGVEGSSNIQLKASGDIDIRTLLKHPTAIRISLIPSANVEVSGRLTVDTLVVESGLKVVSTLHTATGGDLTMSIESVGVDLKFALPVKEQKLISVTHDIVFHSREWGAPEVNVPIKFAQNKDFSICLDQAKAFIGLTFCAEVAGPNVQGQHVPILPFPLSGDAKFSLTVEQEDLSYFRYREVYHLFSGNLSAEYLMEALDQNHQKKLSFGMQISLAPETFLTVDLSSPVTSATLEARVIRNPDEKSVLVRFAHDNNEYYGKVGVAIQASPGRSVYKPILQFKTPENSGVQVPQHRLEGQVVVEEHGPKTVYNLDNVRLIIPNQKTISVNGKFGQEPQTVFADITASDGTNSASVNGKLHVGSDVIKYNLEFKNSINRDANFLVRGEISKAAYEMKNFFQVVHGGDFSNKNNVLLLENSYKHSGKGPHDYAMEAKNKLSYPNLGLLFQVDFEYKPRAVGYKVDVQYTNVKLGSELEWEYNQKRDGTDYKLEFEIWGLNNRVSLDAKRQVSGDQSQIDNVFDFNGKRVEIKGKVRHHVKPQDVDVGSDLTVKLPTHNAPFHVVNGLKINVNELDVSHKVTSGATVFVDLFLKVNKAGNANGNIKVNLEDQLKINGQVKATQGNGNGHILIELPSLQRSSKIDSTFIIREPKLSITLNIYPVFNQDKSKKITLSTQNVITQQSLDSKNFIDVFGVKLEGNVKGNQHGDLQNGKMNGEAELILPNGQYFAGKINRELQTANKVMNGNFVANLEHRANKNQPGSKVTLKGQLRNTNPQENIYDVQYQLSAERANGQNLNIDLGVKRQPQGNNVRLELNNKIYGSVLQHPLETSFKGTCDGIVGSFESHSSYGPDVATIKGKHDFTGAGRPLSAEINLDAKGSSGVIRNLRAGISGSVLKGDVLDVKGSANVYADASDGVIIDFNGNGEVRASDKEGRVKGSVKSGKLDPISIDTGFTLSESKDQDKVQGDVSLHYGKNQNIKGDVTLIKLPKHEYKLDLKLDTPVEQYRQNRLQVHSKRNEENTHFQSEVVLTSNGKTWTSNSDLVLSEITPSVDIKVKCPEGKLRQLTAKITKLTSEGQLAAQLKIVNQKTNFLLEGSIDANVETVENFHIKATANSPSLKIDKVVFEAQNKPGKTGRRIQVNAKSGNKNILAGSTSYTAREEHGKLIIEGSGSFKVRDQTKSANFKYIRQNLSQEKNGETGIEISFDAGLGNQAIDAELKVTNKQFRILESYCEEKKQCAHIEIDIKTNADDLNHYNQEIEIAIDLRKLGLSHEFGLKAVTNRKEYVLDHTVDVHFQSQENSKYQYSLYLHPREAGVSLTTPRRIISLEANVNVPQTLLKDGGKVTGEIALYMDKKHQPNQKSSITGWLNVDPRNQNLEGEARFTNPGLRRPLSVSLNSRVTRAHQLAKVVTVVVLDIFALPDQKLTITVNQQVPDNTNAQVVDAVRSVNIRSQGLRIDIHGEEYVYVSRQQNLYRGGEKFRYQVGNSRYESEASYEVSPTHLQVLLRVLNIDLFKLHSKMQLGDKVQVIDSEVLYYGERPLVSHLELKDWNRLKYTLARKENPNDKLQINTGFIPGQIADFRAEVIKGGAPHELGHATIKLDDANFLKSDYNVQSKSIEEFLLNPIKNNFNDRSQQLQQVAEQLTTNANNEIKELSSTLDKAAPNFTPFRQYYTNELTKIKEEILADKTIKDASEFLYNILLAVSEAFGESFNHFSELVENLAHSFQNSFGKILEAIDKELLPKAKQIAQQVLGLVGNVVNAGVELVLTIGAKAAEIAEKYQPELQQLATVFGEVSQDVLRAVLRIYDTIRSLIAEEGAQIYKELKALPAFEQLTSEYDRLVKQGFPGPEALTNSIKDLVSTLKDLAPFEELKALVQAIGDYVHLKITNQKVDDSVAIDKIIKASLAVVRKLVDLVTGEAPTNLENVKVPLPVNILNKLPRLAAVRFSVLSYLLREDVDYSDFLLSLVNKPRNWVPPFPLYGLIIQGQHIFTFDGQHMTFPGKCNYLLARDVVDGNFTIVGTYNNGLLTAISLTQGSDTLTLKKGGQVLLNRAPTELPARRHDVAAFRDYEKIELVSSYGVHVTCEPDLVACSVKASGFYHGKLRGLLGNGNNEPYDDFALPNGKIVTSESEFGNSYKTTSGCAAVQAVEGHHAGHKPAPGCDKLFGWESTFRYCYPFVNVQNYKTACEHGVAAGVKDTEYAMAIAYVAACNQHGIPIRLPSEYVKCTNGDKPTSLGDQFSIKTPGKSADIVLLVDTVKHNEQVYKEYVQPLVQQLTNELHSKGINDVEFHLIAYGGENQWPSHITTNGGKMTFKGKSPNLKFSENPKHEHLNTGCKITDGLVYLITHLGHDVKLAFGQDLQAQTYNEGLEYPFRANAIKSIIAVTSRPCEIGRLFPLQLLRTLLYRDKSINLNLITPVEHEGGKKDAKHIVGFNGHNVFTSSQGKNKIKPLSDLYKDMDYSDYCIDFTVQNDGNVFFSNHVLEQPKGSRKQLVQLTSHQIVEQYLGTERGYDCECRYVSPFSAANVCEIVSHKDKIARKTGSKS